MKDSGIPPNLTNFFSETPAAKHSATPRVHSLAPSPPRHPGVTQALHTSTAPSPGPKSEAIHGRQFAGSESGRGRARLAASATCELV